MAMLQRLGDKAQCPINSDKLRIGRVPDNDIVIEDKSVSGHHAVILLGQSNEEGVASYIIEDLGSTNKTYVNNTAITNHQLVDGDVIKIGKTRLKFSSEDCEPPEMDFEKTTKISNKSFSHFFFGK
ncbi:MAG: FHA domain-containing protein [Thiohalomonadales bacterium]